MGDRQKQDDVDRDSLESLTPCLCENDFSTISELGEDDRVVHGFAALAFYDFDVETIEYRDTVKMPSV